MKKILLGLMILASVSSFADIGDSRILHKGVNVNIVKTEWSNTKHLLVGEAHYTLSDYNFDTSEVSAVITEAKRLGKVIDFVVIETRFGDDDLVLELRELTEDERSNQILILREENIQLKRKIESQRKFIQENLSQD